MGVLRRLELTLTPGSRATVVVALWLFSGCRLGYEMLGEQGRQGAAGESSGGAVFGNAGDTGASASAGDSTAEGGSTPGGAGSIGGAAGEGEATAGGATGGMGGSSGAGGSSGGVSGNSGNSGNGGNSGSGGAPAGDLVVTTGVDENDAGASVAAPGGAGLSLREAINIANTTAGAQVITFETGVVVALTDELPVISEGLTIAGGVVDGAGAPNNKDCLLVAAGPSTIDGLQITSCKGRPVYVTGGNDVHIRNCTVQTSGAALEVTATAGTGTVIGPDNTIAGSLSHCVAIYNDGSQVVDNRITDCGSSAVFLSGNVAGANIIGNLMLRANFGVGMASGTTGAVMWFNTIAQCASTAINVGQATANDARNNILANNGQYGVSGATSRFTHLDYNLSFGNGTTACNACTPGPNSLDVDPLFVNPAVDDYTLKIGSPAINAGTSLGVDRNGATVGDFNGAKPDLGYRESL
jgi:hypothetical protein